MTIPADWRSHREPEGAHAIRITLDAGAGWSSFSIRSAFAQARSDIAEIIEAAPYNALFFGQRAIIRSVEIQNTSDVVDALVSDRVPAEVLGTDGDPDPSDSYNLVMKNGGVTMLRFGTREEQSKFQYRGVGGDAVLNAEIRFSVPYVTGEDLNPTLVS